VAEAQNLVAYFLYHSVKMQYLIYYEWFWFVFGSASTAEDVTEERSQRGCRRLFDTLHFASQLNELFLQQITNLLTSFIMPTRRQACKCQSKELLLNYNNSSCSKYKELNWYDQEKQNWSCNMGADF